jgi:hypothetical protein
MSTRDARTNAHCSAYSCVCTPIRTEMTQKFIVKFPTTKFHENPLSGSHAVIQTPKPAVEHSRLLSQTQSQLHVSAHIKPPSGVPADGQRQKAIWTGAPSATERAHKCLSKTKPAVMCNRTRSQICPRLSQQSYPSHVLQHQLFRHLLT